MKKIFLIVFLIFSVISAEGNTSMGIKKNSDGTYTILNNNLELKISPQDGGKIISFMLDGDNLIVRKEDKQSSYGSTFWPSPQAMWNWPPLKALDRDHYSVKEENSKIILTSDVDPKTQLRFSKIITGPVKANTIELPFIITNEGDKDISVAPWQVTRVGKGGLLFFPYGEREMTTKYFEVAPTKEIDGIVWYQSNKEEPLKSNLLNVADGKEGWLAYASGNKLFVKKFPEVSTEQIAPGEGDVLFYVDMRSDLIEIEVQGPYKKLKPGESSEWTVEWFAFEIPSNIKIEAGSKELVEFVRNKIN